MKSPYDLDQAWDQVLKAFEKTARVKLQPEKVLTPATVIQQLRLKREHDEEASTKHEKLKQALSRALTCIQTLGMVASKDQSGVLGPSNLVYCAIVLLIQAGEAFKMIYENLERLWDEVSSILERFDLYQNMSELDEPLKKIVHELLQSMVSICALSIKVLNGNKLVKYLKALAFNEDDGVRAELSKVRKLVEREASMNATLTYRYTKEGLQDANEGISGVRSAVDRLAHDVSKRESDSLEQRQLDRIKTVFGVQKEVDRQDALNRQHRSEIVAGTGRWLIEDETYKRWADIGSDFSGVILLSGDHGYGKSFLCTSVIRELQKNAPRAATLETNSRVVIAYYYLQSQDTTSSHGIDSEVISVDRVLKTLTAQLAQDPVYRKTLAATCESWEEPEDIEELCIRLLGPCYRSTDVFYLVIDGLDRAGEKQIKGLASVLKAVNTRFSPRQQSHVRILASGRVQVMQDLSARLKVAGLATVTINIAANTRPDVALFVQDRLDSMQLLGGDSGVVKQLRKEVFHALVQTVAGDFVHASLLLNEISTKQWPTEIREILANAKQGAQRSDTIAREVARCNSVLSPREIRDLNVLLLWVSCAERSLTIAELESVLFLAKGESSLRSLRDQIQDKYSAFFHIDEASGSPRVALSSEPIREYFAEASEQEQLAAQTSHKIQDSEVKILRHFLASVCDNELYTKFGFDDFFARKLNSAAVFIHVDLESAGITLLTGCLLGLTHPTNETSKLNAYATAWFPKHMAAVDLSMSSPAAKVACGRHLLQLFTDTEVIARWWDIRKLEAQTSWFYTDDNVDLVLAFFRDTAITKTFTEEERVWIKTLTSKSSPESDLLEHIVRHLCRQLLANPSGVPDIRTAYSCLNAYRSMLFQRKDPQTKRTAGLKNYQVTAPGTVDLFTWLASILGEVDPTQSYEWNSCLATVLAEFGHIDAATAQYQIAIALATDGWESQFGLGIALRQREEFQASNEVLEDVERRIVDGRAQRNNPDQHLRSVRQIIAWNYRQLDQYDAALEVYAKHIQESKERNLTDYGFTFDRIRVLSYQKNHAAIIDILRTMRMSIDPNFGIKHSSRLLHWMCDDMDFEMILVETSKATKSHAYLSELFSEAIDDAHKPQYLSSQPANRAMYRVILKWYLSEEMWRRAWKPEQKEETITYWEQLAKDCLDIDANLTYTQVAKRLATVYIQRMRDYPPGSTEAQTLCKKAIDLAVDDTLHQDAWASVNNPRILLARHMSLLGRNDHARTLARGSIKIALDLLSDEDPENDWEAHIRLAMVLMYCGQDEDALAAWSLLWPLQVTKQLGRSNSVKVSRRGHLPINGKVSSVKKTAVAASARSPGKESQLHEIDDGSDLGSGDGSHTSEDGEEAANERWWEGDIEYLCDGFCGGYWTYADDIHVCKDCLDVMFCGDCLEKLRVQQLEENICDPAHEFLHVPEFDADEALGRGKDHVRLRGEKVPVSVWLSQIRDDWGLVVTEVEKDEYESNQSSPDG